MTALVLLTLTLPGQYLPGRATPDAHQRRAAREWAVARIGGPDVRAFVESDHGDRAVAALANCRSAIAGRKLAKFHADGELDKLADPEALLECIAAPGNGERVCLWAIEHSRQLHDADALAAFCREPWEYVHALKNLADGAARVRASRLQRQERPGVCSLGDWKLWALGGAVIVAVYLALKARRA